MIHLRPAHARGESRRGGHQRRHAFASPAPAPAWSGFGVLRLLDEETLAPGYAAAPARYANVEVLLLVLEGQLEWAAAGAAPARLDPGDGLWLGAGHGLDVALSNPDPRQPLRLLQLWLQPGRLNARPAWAQARFERHARHGRWQRLAAPDGHDGALPLRQQAEALAAALHSGEALARALDPAQRYWLQVLSGQVRCGAHALAAGDALALEGEAGLLALHGVAAASEVLLLALPA